MLGLQMTCNTCEPSALNFSVQFLFQFVMDDVSYTLKTFKIGQGSTTMGLNNWWVANTQCGETEVNDWKALQCKGGQDGQMFVISQPNGSATHDMNIKSA